MINRKNTNILDTSLFDPEHDMDLVALVNNARTEDERHNAFLLSRSRMRARAASQGRRRGFAAKRSGLLRRG